MNEPTKPDPRRAGRLQDAARRIVLDDVQGTAVSVFDDPFKRRGHARLRRADRAAPRRRRAFRDVENGDGGEIDELAAASISDIEEFWETAYSETFDGDFTARSRR